MDAGIWFWLIYVLTALGFIGSTRTGESWRGVWVAGGSIVIFVLLGLLGWGVFGSPIK